MRPDGREVPRLPAAPAPCDAGVEAIQRNHGADGLSIDARTGVPGWGGEAADYNYMLMMLGQREEMAGKAPT